MNKRGYTPANVLIVVLIVAALFVFFYAFVWMLQSIGQATQLLDALEANPLLTITVIGFFIVIVGIMLFGILEGHD